MCIRTWAVWRRNKVVGIGLAVSMLAYLVSVCVVGNAFFRSVDFGPPQFVGFRGCFMIKASRCLWWCYVPMVVVPSIALTLMLISAFRLCRQGLHGGLIHVIHKDGILFYVYLLCFTAATMVTVITLPVDLITIMLPLQEVLYVVFTSRVILNIRQVNNRAMQTELHTYYNEPIAFAKPPALSTVRDSEQGLDDQDGAAWSQSRSQYVGMDDMQAP